MRKESYSREYDYVQIVRGTTQSDPKDTVVRDLRAMCIEMKGMYKHQLGDLVLYDGDVFARIYVDSGNSQESGRYVRNVSVEIMPRSGKMPKELTSLLREKGFVEEKKGSGEGDEGSRGAGDSDGE